MATTQFREGSAGAADKKAMTTTRIVLAVVTIILIILLFTVPLLKSEAAQTGGGFKFLSAFCWLVAFGAIGLEPKISASRPTTVFYFIWFISMGLGFLFAIIGGI